jgi:endonuclease/exonuclease/phosphatase family metal-dependent hydrolase
VSLLNSGAAPGVATTDTYHRTNTNNNSNSRRPIRCLQWNIERNYKADEILATLTELDADILCIQEIDIGCHRSGHDRNHFLEICKSQGLFGGFVPEFWELEHPGRKDRDQGGGVHGNAILSRWPINGFRVLDHVHHAYEWERDGLKLNEPRLGR